MFPLLVRIDCHLKQTYIERGSLMVILLLFLLLLWLLLLCHILVLQAVYWNLPLMSSVAAITQDARLESERRGLFPTWTKNQRLIYIRQRMNIYPSGKTIKYHQLIEVHAIIALHRTLILLHLLVQYIILVFTMKSRGVGGGSPSRLSLICILIILYMTCENK